MEAWRLRHRVQGGRDRVPRQNSLANSYQGLGYTMSRPCLCARNSSRSPPFEALVVDGHVWLQLEASYWEHDCLDARKGYGPRSRKSEYDVHGFEVAEGPHFGRLVVTVPVPLSLFPDDEPP
jgi:hypothetical protein